MQRNSLTIVILLFCLGFSVPATASSAPGGKSPAPDTLWVRTYGGLLADYCGYSVEQTPDGGYIFVGASESPFEYMYDICLIKTDRDGEVAFNRTYVWDAADVGYSVHPTRDGGFVITGCGTSFGMGSHDIYLIKVDEYGDTLWTRVYGGPALDMAFSVRQTSPDDGFVVVGVTDRMYCFLNDIILLKTDANGDSVWARTYGGDRDDVARSVEQTQDGGFIIGGTTESFGKGGLDIYLIKTDADGDTIWTRTFGGPEDETGTSVKETADGGFIVVGTTASFGAGCDDVFMVRTDRQGKALWTRTFGGEGYESGLSVDRTPDGGFVIAGSLYPLPAGPHQVYILRTDPSGKCLWTRTYAGAGVERGNAVTVTSEGAYIIACRGSSLITGERDMCLMKLGADR
jgi:hypothetical protein